MICVIKKTFYNLPEEKRQRIIDAIMKEFAGSTTEKVSINRIVKSANISRGSFYQYFDDKVDLVEVLTTAFIDITIEKIFKALKNSNGDIFYTYEKLFDIIANLADDSKEKMIIKNLAKNIKANDNIVSEYMLNRFKGFVSIQDIAKSFNRDNLKYKDDYDVDCLSQILMQILKNAIFDLFVMNADKDKLRKKFLRKLEIVKTGAVSRYNIGE